MLWIAAAVFFVLRKLAIKIDGKVSERLAGQGGRGGGRGKGKGKGKTWTWSGLLPFVCLMMMVWALAYAPLPWGWGTIAGFLAVLLGWVLGLVGGIFGVTGGMIAAVILLGLVALALWDIVIDGEPDGVAKSAVFALPVLVLVASGPIAPVMQDLIQTVNGATPSFVATLTGS